jgi:hypothetical protein
MVTRNNTQHYLTATYVTAFQEASTADESFELAVYSVVKKMAEYTAVSSWHEP